MTLANAVKLNGLTGRIAAFDNDAVAGDHAVLTGAFTGGSLIVNDTQYGGAVYMTAQNALSGLTVNNGLVSTRFKEATGRLMDGATGGFLQIHGGRVEMHGAEKVTYGRVQDGAELAAFATITSNWLDNRGSAAFYGDAVISDLYNAGSAAFYGKFDGAWISNHGDLLLGGGAGTSYLYNGATATLMTLGDINVAGETDNRGLWTMAGNLTTDRMYQHGYLALLGDMVDGAEIAMTRTITARDLWGSSEAVIGLGGMSGAIAHTLRLDLAGSGEFAGVIDGAGELVKTGAGTLLLSGANSFTGGLTIEQGGIETTVSGTLADTLAISVEQPGTFIWGSQDVVASLANAGITRIHAFASMEELANSGLLDLNAPLTVSGTLANKAIGTVSVAAGAGAKLGQHANEGHVFNAGELLVTGAARNEQGATLTLASGSTNRFGSLTNAGSIGSDATIVVDGAFTQTAGTLGSSADLWVGGDYGQTVSSVDLGATLQVRGALALRDATLKTGEAVTVSGDMTSTAADVAIASSLTAGGTFAQQGGVAKIGTDMAVLGGVSVTNGALVTGAALVTGGDYGQGGGNTTVGAGFGVGGRISLSNGELAVGDAAAVQGSYAQQGGATTIGRTLDVIGALTVGDGQLMAGGEVTVGGDLVSGNAELATPAALKVGGSYVQSGGKTALGTDVTVRGALSLANGTLTAGGAIIAGGGYVQDGGSATVGTDLGAGGSFRLTDGQLAIAREAAVLGSYVQTLGSVDVRGGVTIGGDYAQQGGSATVGQRLDVTGGLTLADGSLAAGGDALIGGSYMQAGGTAMIAGGLEVRGDAGLTGAELAVGGNVLANGDLAQTGGTSTIGGTLGVGGNLGLVNGTLATGSDVIVVGAYRQEGGSLKVAGNLLVGGALTLDAGNIAAAGDIAAGALSGTGGRIVLAEGRALAIDQTMDGTFSGTITGDAASVIKSGNATLTLAGAQGSFAPAQLFITAGTVAVDGAGILDTALAVDIAANAGLTLLTGDQTINNLSGFGTLALNGNDLNLANGGNFFGTVTGTGSVSLTSGSFDLSNSVDVEDGSFVVERGSALTVKQGGKLNATNVQVTGSLDVAGTVSAGNTTVDGGVLHLGAGSGGGTLDSKVLQVANGGQLTGNGAVRGATTIGGSSAGVLAPGNSPGVIRFADLTLGGQSTTIAEIDGTAGAGNADGHDLIAVSGTLTLQDGSTLAIASSTEFEPVLGQRVQIFDVAPGAVSGQFGTITSAFANTVALNLSTGTIVGLGDQGGESFIDAATTTANQRAMLEKLRIATGTVDQYRGGRLVEQVAGALAAGDAAGLTAIFDRASPEAYTALADHQRLSVLNGLADLGGYAELADRAFYATGSIAYEKARSRDQDGFVRFRTRDNRFTIGFAGELAVAKVQMSYTRSDGEVDARYLHGDATGDIFAAGVSAPLALDGGLRVMARISHGEYRFDGDRITNGGAASFDGVDGSTTVYGGGLELVTASPRVTLGLSAEVLSVTSKVDGFAEGGALPLDALDIAGQKDDTAVLRARVTGGYRFAPNWHGIVKLGLDQDLSDPLLAVTGGVVSEDAPFTVRNPGITNTRASIGLGTAVDLTSGLRWSVEGDVGNASRMGARTSVTLRF